MYNIVFFRDVNGREEFFEYLEVLRKNSVKNKDVRIKYEKIIEYLEVLERYGTRTGLPYTKHIEDEIWELRPLNERIMLAFWYENNIVILHHFIKTTQKTPKKEIEKAKRNLKDFLERIDRYEK